jgi:hypothetical protein
MYVFVYERRYKFKTFTDRLNARIEKSKARLLKWLIKSRFSKKLAMEDIFMFEHSGLSKKIKLSHAFIDQVDQDPFIYEGISLPRLYLFEALEIDDFDRYKIKLMEKFPSQTIFSKSKTELRKDIAGIRDNLGVISTGDLFYLDYKKQGNIHNDLINNIEFSYLKTSESYFILQFTVTPSKKFNELFTMILKEEDHFINQPDFRSFYQILKTGRFIHHENVISNSKTYAIRNLVADLDYQVRRNCTRHLNGFFHRNRNTAALPRIEYYEVENLQDFKKDHALRHLFRGDFESPFQTAGIPIEVYLWDFDDAQSLIQVVKQKGYSQEKNSENDSTNWSHVESSYLCESLAFPCVFKAILSAHWRSLKELKREIYDFVISSSKSRLRSALQIFFKGKKYIYLKIKLAKIGLTLKRFEDEASIENLHYYMSKYPLNNFVDSRKEPKHKSLLEKFIKNFSWQVKELDRQTRGINEVFRSIEEINVYRTNLMLQLISILIAILAIIFTFDKVKSFLSNLFR